MPLTDGTMLGGFFARAARRRAWILATSGAAGGLTLVVAVATIRWLATGSYAPPGPASLVAPLVAALLGVTFARHERSRIAILIEQRIPSCRNLLVTAHELLEQQTHAARHADPYVGDLVFRDAARVAGSLRPGVILPAGWAIGTLLAGSALWCLAVTRPASVAIGGPHPIFATPVTPALGDVTVVVTEPAYAHGTRQTLHNPARIEALAGSRIHLIVRAAADSVGMETIAGRQPMTRGRDAIFTGEFTVDGDGYVALEPVGSGGRAGGRRLIGVAAVPDRAPVVRITTPGHDIKLPDGHATVDLAVDASDDIGLASLHLRYTRVSGSGERYTFTEGEVPLAVARSDSRHWAAHAAWRLDSLALDPGDMVVYRATAADDRPGSAATESDSYIAEVVAPGSIAATGFALDPEEERYALSQEMVILKTEHLLARKSALAADVYADSAADLAAEQRRVRAEYVFMMGGEVGGADDAIGNLNEEAEAAGEGDLAAQRLLNQGRNALLNSIRAMSRAAAALDAPELAAALTHERVALAQLELTFSHTKVILRALTERERLDLTRRLTGTLADAARNVRPVREPARDPRVTGLRAVLSGIATLAATAPAPAAAAASARTLAERLLRLDPASAAIQAVAARLDSAATRLADTQPRLARPLIDRAATGLTAIVRESLLDAPQRPTTTVSSALAGALRDALRRPVGTP